MCKHVAFQFQIHEHLHQDAIASHNLGICVRSDFAFRNAYKSFHRRDSEPFYMSLIFHHNDHTRRQDPCFLWFGVLTPLSFSSALSAV